MTHMMTHESGEGDWMKIDQLRIMVNIDGVTIGEPVIRRNNVLSVFRRNIVQSDDPK